MVNQLGQADFFSYTLEGIQANLVRKTQSAPGYTINSYKIK